MNVSLSCLYVLSSIFTTRFFHVLDRYCVKFLFSTINYVCNLKNTSSETMPNNSVYIWICFLQSSSAYVNIYIYIYIYPNLFSRLHDQTVPHNLLAYHNTLQPVCVIKPTHKHIIMM